MMHQAIGRRPYEIRKLIERLIRNGVVEEPRRPEADSNRKDDE
jgi:hypothetical protein